MKKIFSYLALVIIGLFFGANTFAASNELVNLLGTVSAGGISTTSDIMSTPIGSVIYFVIGLIAITIVVSVIVGIFFFAKGQTK